MQTENRSVSDDALGEGFRDGLAYVFGLAADGIADVLAVGELDDDSRSRLGELSRTLSFAAARIGSIEAQAIRQPIPNPKPWFSGGV